MSDCARVDVWVTFHVKRGEGEPHNDCGGWLCAVTLFPKLVS